MWNWDQGRMPYFQYDVIRAVASYVVSNDIKNTDPDDIRAALNLDFSPQRYTPWRNYSRVFKLCLLVAEVDGKAVPTNVSAILSEAGAITCDEYLHFITKVTTYPHPALSEWKNIDAKPIRSPLCFALKYVLVKLAALNEPITPIDEIIKAYVNSDFLGNETDEEYLDIIAKKKEFSNLPDGEDSVRQARESIKFICQISYLNNVGKNIIVSLGQSDAHDIFHALSPAEGLRESDGNQEILRLSRLLKAESENTIFEYKGTVISDELESGFVEGSKIKKTHIIIERNSQLRKSYFKKYPSPVCRSCEIDTNKKYPWTEKVLDLHHILPLSSGTQVDTKSGTLLEHLEPVCPTCHRAIHRYYDLHLKKERKKDFSSAAEAVEIYKKAKDEIVKEKTNA